MMFSIGKFTAGCQWKWFWHTGILSLTNYYHFSWKLYIHVCMNTLGEVDVQLSIMCCFRATGHCTHILALLKTLQGLKLHNFTNVPCQHSCTSIPQQWNVPRGDKIQPVPINHVVVARPKDKDRKRKPVVCHFNTDYKRVARWNFDWIFEIYIARYSYCVSLIKIFVYE